MFKQFDPNAVRVERHRLSTTQGEVTVRYAGQYLGRWFDNVVLQGGEWHGQDDAHWIKTAATVLKCRMAAQTQGHLTVRRLDGVEFVADTHSPNGHHYEPGWIVNAGDLEWASVLVGRFSSLAEVSAAIDAFVMPPRRSRSCDG